MSVTLERNLLDPKSPIEKEIAALGSWFQNLHLPDGTQTAPDHPLGDFPKFKWEQIAPHIPDDITGWNVLEIGCNAGFYSFELAKRGAHVLGIDVDQHYLKQADWAKKYFNLKGSVEFKQMHLFEIVDIEQKFDLILFMGVLYHLRYPLLALDLIASKVEKKMVFQTMTMPEEQIIDTPLDIGIFEREQLMEPGWPRMAFIEHSLAGDHTNWWVPNYSAVEAMLRSSGLIITAKPAHEIYICTKDPDNKNNHLNDVDTAVKGANHLLNKNNNRNQL